MSSRLAPRPAAPGGRSAPGSSGAVSVLEDPGRRWYGHASDSMRGLLTGMMPVVTELAEHFGLARRTLNLLTDRPLFGHRTDGFGEPTS